MANQYVDLTHTAIEVDSSISTVTTHVADTVIHVSLSDRQTWDAKQSALTFDSAPSEGSTNPVTSGGIYTAVSGKCALSDVYGMGVVLQPTAEEPADMDNITTVGAYTCSATYIANLAHRPESKTSVNLYFEVRRLTATRWMQTAYYQSNDADSFYIRWKTLNSWTVWRKFTGTAV